MFADNPHIIDTIIMYRKVRGWSYAQARDSAIEEYRRRGWFIPPPIEALYKFTKKAGINETPSQA
jgi:hypothetical protein